MCSLALTNYLDMLTVSARFLVLSWQSVTVALFLFKRWKVGAPYRKKQGEIVSRLAKISICSRDRKNNRGGTYNYIAASNNDGSLAFDLDTGGADELKNTLGSTGDKVGHG